MINDYNDRDKMKLAQDKKNLETTLQDLTKEVEELSSKNEEFLVDLQKRDFYDDYWNASRELNELRDAHMLLINLIENHDIPISNDAGDMQFYQKNQQYFSPERGR